MHSDERFGGRLSFGFLSCCKIDLIEICRPGDFKKKGPERALNYKKNKPPI